MKGRSDNWEGRNGKILNVLLTVLFVWWREVLEDPESGAVHVNWLKYSHGDVGSLGIPDALLILAL